MADPTTSPSAEAPSEGSWRGTAILLAIVLAGVIAGPVLFSHLSETKRLARIENAERKYSLTYLRSVGDGEGGGMWRHLDGTVITCRTKGTTQDPTLACGPEDTEPTFTPAQAS